jgi:hypothetical protein
VTRAIPRSSESLVRASLLAALLAAALPPGSALSAPADSSARNLVAIEFVESPPSGLVVTGGLLGVPDSSGRFPEVYQRYDPVTGQGAKPGQAFGDVLVFTDLAPGTYRVALVFLGESRLARRLYPKDRQPLEDRCLVYGDSITGLSFTIGPGEARYLGRLTRRSRPTLDDKHELWDVQVQWAPGDERKVLKGLLKRKPLAPWRPWLAARAETLGTGKR